MNNSIPNKYLGSYTEPASYPALLVPYALSTQLPYAATPQPPKAPAVPTKSRNRTLFDVRSYEKAALGIIGFDLLIFLVLKFSYLSIFAVGFDLPPVALWGVVLVVAIGPIYRYLIALNNTATMAKEYSRENEDYKKRKAHYEKALENYNSYAERSMRETSLGKLRKEQFQDTLNKTLFEFEVTSLKDQPIGASERMLFDALKMQFPNKVRMDVAVPRSKKYDGGRYTVRPDITFHDGPSKLTIAIEVDEPYVFDTGKPIHYVGADEQRNKDFVDAGWLVVRFSEKQVVMHTQDCAQFIQRIYDTVAVAKNFIDPSKVEAQSNYFPATSRDPMWSESDARSMAFQEYRKSYTSSSS